MAWFALYILYSLLSLLLTAFDLFYGTTLLVFPCSLFLKLFVLYSPVNLIKTSDKYLCILIFHMSLKWGRSNKGNIDSHMMGQFHHLVIGLFWSLTRWILFMDEILLAIQYSLHFSHVWASVHNFISRRLVLFNLLVFSVHLLFLLVHIFLMLRFQSGLL